MQNLGVGISIQTIFNDKGIKLAQSSLSSLKSVTSSTFKSTITPKTNITPLNTIKTTLDSIKAKIKGLNSEEVRIKAKANMDSFKSSIMEKVALGAGIVMPIKAAINFESAMADVNKVVDFDSQKELQSFSAEIRNLSKTIPLVPTELAKITASGGALGVAKEKLMDFTTLVAKMSTAFDMDAEQAGDTMAKIMNVYGLGLKEMEGLGDAMNHISDNSAAKAKDIAEVLGRIGGTANVMGLSAQNAAALGSAFLAMGKAPEVAGTAINSFFTKLLAPEEQTAGFKKALEQIGLSAEELKDSIQKDPQKGIEDFLQTLTKVEKADQMGILSNLFGANFGDDMALLVKGIDNYKKAVNLANTKDNIGSLQREFETRSATTENALILLKSSLINVGISIGNVVLPSLNALISIIRPITDGISNFASRFPTLTKVIVGSAVGIGTLLIIVPTFMFALSAMTLGLGKAVLGFKALSTAVLFLSRAFLFNPIGLALTAIAGVGFLIYKHWTPLKEVFSNVVNSIQESFSRVWNYLKSVFSWNPLGLIASAFTPINDFFQELLGGWIARFKTAVSIIGETLSSIKGFFGFGESTLKSSLEEKKIETLQVSPLTPSSTQNNISVAFTGGIQVQTTDGKIPENSQLQRDIQREVEMALKKAKQSERDRSFSDLDF
ncbi:MULTISPECIES: phage tail tape measure protein [Helicobacter]|uniref:Phage tail tape measure protein n=1 Tax=Helicobacter apodemus TaxID=135569 RepID=A0A4U8UDT3_9HELI|nr:phage tail tape measure protein [Helicobacter apodemus]TLE14459.1 phage tail tape measure protein [Helicobacter apodemus]